MLVSFGVRLILYQHLPVVLIILSFVGHGDARVTSTFVRSEWPSTDIPLENEAFAIPKGHNAPQQVHITQGDYDGKAVIISWVTTAEPGTSKVQYGTSKDNSEFTAEGTVTNYNFYNYKSGYIHHCLVDGLEYNTKYYYKIGVGDSSREFWFQTPPKIDPDASYTFGVIGDLGQTFNSLSTLEHYMQSGGQTVLYVGDLSYADRYTYNDVGIRWDSWGRFIERSTAYQPWIWSAGNHEIEYMPNMLLKPISINIVFVAFKLPDYKGKFFHLSHICKGFLHPILHPIAAILFGMLSGGHLRILLSYPAILHLNVCISNLKEIVKNFQSVKSTPQWMWLREELKKVDREKTPWLIILMHMPIYSSNLAHYMEGESMRAVFESWFVCFKVDLIFAGHYRISNIHYNVSSGDRYPVPDKSAPVYITVGDGGNQEGLAGRFWDPQPDYSAFREASYGHSTLEIRNRTHAFYHWNRNDDGKKVKTDSVETLKLRASGTTPKEQTPDA
ncbi:bifunctional purple acid phosphatase 26 [Quercus suber]|uniref:Purple acid phosphatase n=1 Tax=Quercus suber TaxID=58331 RepID=A0AAW0LEP6_QUESU